MSKARPEKKRRVRPVLPPGEANAPSASVAPKATREPGRVSFRLDIAGKDAGQIARELARETRYWMQRGRFTRVRILRRGEPVTPDIPVAGMLAAEALSIVLLGPLRLVLAHVAGQLFFDVELVSDASVPLKAAREHYAQGELAAAAREAERALKIDPRLADAEVFLGVLAKVRGEIDVARRHWQRARELDPQGQIGHEALELLRRLDESA